MLSLGMFSARAAWTARRRREFISGSGRPFLTATVISRASLANSLERAASWRPLRCMMFLNCEWPAMLGLVREANIPSQQAYKRAFGANPDRRSTRSQLRRQAAEGIHP